MGAAGALSGWIPWEHLTVDRMVLIMIALPGGLVALRTLYKLYKYGGERIWDVIEAYFKEELEKISKRRSEILAHIQRAPRVNPDEAIRPNVHETIDEAISLFDRGRTKEKLRAEAILRDLADTLADKATMADQRAKLARDQAATALVLMGAIAQSRDDRAVALTAFDGALSHRPRDPDATKLIGMLRPAEAVKRFSDLEDIAVELEDKSLEAEALRLKASALGPGNNARQALQEAASIEENITPKNFGRLGQTYRQWADVSAQLDGHNGTPWRAIGRYEKAAEYFLLDGDRTAADAAAALAKALIGGQRKPPEPLSTI